MDKAKFLKKVNLFLFVLFPTQAVTGLGRDLLPEDVFFTVHYYCGLILIACVITHFSLNWSWVRSNYLKK